LNAQPADSIDGVEPAALDPFRGYAVRHEAPVIRVGWKDPPPGCRSSPVKLRVAGPGVLVGWEAALTKPGRSSTARWAGSGKRGRQSATGVNRWFAAIQGSEGSTRHRWMSKACYRPVTVHLCAPNARSCNQ
jgi:hypothetical protein